MITPDYCQLMAQYNRWMNERLYETCAALTDVERKLERGAFFGSIHGTLNHLLWGDRMWLGRFRGPPCTHPQFGADMFASFDVLRTERAATDRAMLDWADQVSAEWLAAPLVYTSVVDRKTRRLPSAIAAVHMFNHGTHHRGQLTTLLKQAGTDLAIVVVAGILVGTDPGITDLPWLPGVVAMPD